MNKEQKVQNKHVGQHSSNEMLVAVGLPIHATNEDNTYTLCGLKVNKSMSYHRGGIMLGMIIGRENVCKECLSHCS